MTKNIKDVTVSKTIWRKFLENGTEVHEVQNVEDYRANGIQVFVQEGKRKDTPTFYVDVKDYTPARRKAASLADKVATIAEGRDLSSMTATELLALLG